MAEIDLGPGLDYFISHEPEERVGPSRPFSAVLEPPDKDLGVVSKLLIAISTRSPRSLFNARLRISVNGFHLSRIARPSVELNVRNLFHQIFLYDLMAIRGIVGDRVEVEVESKDLELVLDGISIAAAIALQDLSRGYNRLYIGPYILGAGERLGLKIPCPGGGFIGLRGLSIPTRRCSLSISLESRSFSRTVDLYTSSEFGVRMPGPEIEGVDDLVVQVSPIDQGCSIKIPWMFLTTGGPRPPDYSISKLSISWGERPRLSVLITNLGDLPAKTVGAVAIYRGSIIGRASARVEKYGEIEIPVSMPAPKSLKDDKLLARIYWKWLGRLEEREAELSLS